MDQKQTKTYEQNKARRMKWTSAMLEATLQLMERSRLTRTQLCVRSGVCRQTIKNWEEGRVIAPNSSTMIAIGKACGYELKWQEKK